MIGSPEEPKEASGLGKRQRSLSGESEQARWQYAARTLRGSGDGADSGHACHEKHRNEDFPYKLEDLEAGSSWEEQAVVQAKTKELPRAKIGPENLESFLAALQEQATALVQQSAEQEERQLALQGQMAKKKERQAALQEQVAALRGEVVEQILSRRQSSKSQQVRLARDLLRKCLVRQVEGAEAAESVILSKANASCWQQTRDAYRAKEAIPSCWSAAALQILELGRQDQCSAYQLDSNARASSLLFMLKSCEELLPADEIVGFKQAFVCGMGQQGDDYAALKARLHARMQSQKAQAGREFLQAYGL